MLVNTRGVFNINMDKEHGIKSNIIMKDLIDVMSVFKKFGVRAFLAYGAVLGATRDKDFIPWDDDVDIDIIDKIDYKTRKKIGHLLGDIGFRTQSISFNVLGRMEMASMGNNGECAYDGDEETGIIVCERNFKFSIFFYKEENDEYVCTPKSEGVKLISNLKKFYEKPSYVKLHGNKFLCPAPIPEYLTYLYGDWKIPLKDKHAPQWSFRHPNG